MTADTNRYLQLLFTIRQMKPFKAGESKEIREFAEHPLIQDALLYLPERIEWKGETIPEIPLFEPEKAAALPVEITFGKEYRYSLRGSDEVEGRDCWVVDFEPAVAVEPGRTLFKGTVWVTFATAIRVSRIALRVARSLSVR